MNSHSLLTGFAILLFIQFVGTWIIGALHIPLPPALLGMVLLTIALLTNVIKINWVEDTCTVLIEKMGMLFVPAGISILLYKDAILKEWFAIFATIFFSSIIVIVTTGLFVDILLRRRRKENA
ncbi:Antiholin-like protein LrgA [bioreactor metagenome]|jgi:Putative effector of murein hydrolase LrgA|uniref:Antiholin-like protein LrgA n=1 Tax=bioreactor metagenome TaxID=1076179 RepID=A0A644V6U2_9ZZZZ|nr:CidA/LrgA family protein [Acidaminococcaceae bacterium]